MYYNEGRIDILQSFFYYFFVVEQGGRIMESEPESMPISGLFIRSTHPLLFWYYVIFSLISIGLGLNFLLTTPTFNPYHIDKEIVGSVFFSIGALNLMLSTVWRKFTWLRIGTAMNMGIDIIWGIGASFTFFQDLTSLQNFCLYIGLAGLKFRTVLEDPITVTTKSVK